jgi:hypothetical protein
MAPAVLGFGGVSVPTENVAVGVCNSASEAEAVVAELRQQGLEPDCLSVVAVDEQSGSTPAAYYFERGSLRSTAARGGGWRLLDALSGCAVLVIPGERTAILAGPFAASVARTLDNEGLFGDLGPIASGLYSLGISRDAARDYELTALRGRALVIVHGRARDVARARRILTDRLQGDAGRTPGDQPDGTLKLSLHPCFTHP